MSIRTEAPSISGEIQRYLATGSTDPCRATQATMVMRRAGGMLTVEVRDDGIGGARAGAAGGLVGLADRVSALGGVVHL